MTVQRVGSDVFVSGVIERHDDRLLRAEFARGEGAICPLEWRWHAGCKGKA